jgi:gliding motility-associated-like protein
MRFINSLFISFFFLPCIIHAQVIINEYSCANRNSFADNFGEFEDWIELRNTSALVVNITGFYLSDNASQPTKWQIPNGVIIPANGYILFFASGKNLVSGSNYHTGFKLTQSNFSEEIVFADPSGNILDSLSIKPTQIGHSRGRRNITAQTPGVFSIPTPGAANNPGFVDYIPRPLFSQPPGFYTAPQTISLQGSILSSTIRYTIDGKEPASNSPVYSTPIGINNTTMIRARCFSNSPDYLDGFIETNTYFINVNHSLPVISVGSDNYDNLFSNSMFEILSSIEYYDVNKVLRFESYGEVDPHGNDSWAYPQKGIDFVVRDQYGYDEAIDYPIFHTKPRQEFQRIMFKAGASDNYPFGPPMGCHLRDMFIQTLAQKAQMNVDLRSAESCVLYINGQYWGLYEIREKVNDPDYTEYYHNQSEEDLDFLSYWGGLTIRYGSDADWVDLYNFMMNNDLSVNTNYQSVCNRIDISSVIDYMIINTFSVNSDWINWNTMWWRGTGSPNVKWRYALWDMDNTFDLGQNFSGWPTTGFQANPCDLNNNFQNVGPNMGHLDMFGRLMANPDFKMRFINRWSEMINSYLDCDYVLAHLDSIVAILLPEMPAQINRWGGSMSGWQSNLDYLRSQIQGRCNVIDSGVVDCYDVSGRHRIVFNVDPPGAGSITFNQQTFANYPDTGSYFGNVNGILLATPSTGYTFAYWETVHHTLLPDSLSSATEFLIDTVDSIVAHFEGIITHDITYIVNPPGSGNIFINGISYPNTPLTLNYFPGMPVAISALSNPGYFFYRYSSSHHILAPSDTLPDVTFQVNHRDTIFVEFRPAFRPLLTLLSSPPGACAFKLNGTSLPNNLFQQDFSLGEPVTLDYESLGSKYLFERWLSGNHDLLPDSVHEAVSFNIIKNDTIVLQCYKREVFDPAIFVPNSFSPNGDGINDYFGIACSETVLSGRIEVYDRWGFPVYTNADIRTALWDGNSKGLALPTGVYAYFIEITEENGGNRLLTGYITILR